MSHGGLRGRVMAAVWPAPGGRAAPLGVAEALRAFRAAIAADALREIERRTPFLWLPVAFGIGICAYFAADTEPSAAYAAMLAILFAGLAFLARHGPWRFAVLAGSAALFAGFTAAAVRTADVAAPTLDRLRIVPVTGFVEAVERRGEGQRLLLAVETMADLPADKRPIRIRVTTRDVAAAPGQFVRMTARLLPPPEPARPGGYDFARESYFRGIGAVGSVSGRIETLDPPRPIPASLALAAAIDRGRNALTDRIAGTFGGQAGAVAAALVTGKRGLIDEDTNDALRAAGIYHIVSISGLHMVLAAGAVFWTLRALLALSATLALAWPVKKIAALGAMAAATAYCIFSGSDVATERSLIMTLVMLGAILVDRPALSMRNLALAALVVMAREPETVLGPSFQMSFGAVAALVAFGSAYLQAREADGPPSFGIVGRAWRSLKAGAAALIVTTILATVATAPFGLFHFQTVNPFGLAGNALALPFVSLIVMPCAVAGTLLHPLGLDTPVWWLMGQGVAIVLSIAGAIEGWPGARAVIPAFGAGALALLALALLIATLLTTRLRWLAILPLALGLGAAARPERPLVLVDRDAAGAAIRGIDGRLVMVGRPSAFVKAQWLAADGDERLADDDSLTSAARCDPKGCVVRLPDGRAASFLTDPGALQDDCGRAAIIVVRGRAPGTCPQALLITRDSLARTGAVAVHEAAGRFRLEGARDNSAARPWARRAPEAPAAQPTSRASRRLPADPETDAAEPDPQ